MKIVSVTYDKYAPTLHVIDLKFSSAAVSQKRDPSLYYRLN
jgi:hypothetical protein